MMKISIITWFLADYIVNLFHFPSGFLVDKDGFVLKMVDLSTAGSCGFTEAGFFGSIFNADDDETELVAIRQFLPSYHGLMQLAIGGEKCILFVKHTQLKYFNYVFLKNLALCSQ